MKIVTAGALSTIVGAALALALVIPFTNSPSGSSLPQGITGNADDAISGQVVYGSR